MGETSDNYSGFSKTLTQIVKSQDPVSKTTEKEINEIESRCAFKYTYARTYVTAADCTQKFKTQRGSKIHSNKYSFSYAYNTTEKKKFEVNNIQVKTLGFEESLMEEDGCKPVIDEYWTSSRNNPACDYYPDKKHTHRCCICG